MTRSKLPIALALTGALVLGLLIPVVAATPAQAADGANFDPGMIISDETFYNSSAMNAGQLQAFLNDKGAGCRANTLPCVKDIVLSYPQRAGDQYCGTLPAASNVRAADMFLAVAIACGINPQVLLVLVEKEQSLISRSGPTDYSYRYATGFACPDSPPGCDDALSGFVTQVYLAAKQFNRYRINPTSYNHQAGRTNNILFNPNAGCGAAGVFIRNQATAGLYNYTPYQPNAAALANLYGTGDGCSSYGNRNFWRMFTDWFGSDTNMLRTASFESSTAGWAFASGSARMVAGPTSDAKSGSHFLSMYAPQAGMSVVQDTPVTMQERDAFVASIWVRSGSAGKQHNGALAIWALGGQQELAVQSFTAGPNWTEVTVQLQVARSGHTAIRFEVYLGSTDSLLSLDAASIMKSTGQPIRPTLALSSPGAEEGRGAWAPIMGAASLTTSTTAPLAGAQVLQASGTGSFGQDVAVAAATGETYTTSIWLKSSEGTISGALALWGLGGPNGAALTQFTVGTEWKHVSATITLAGAASALRPEVYFTGGAAQLFADEAQISANLATNPSFEGATLAWNSGMSQNVLQRIAGTTDIPAVDGANLAATVGFTGGSIATDIKRRTSAGETYTATLWLRTAAAGTTWTGDLALWALGGAQEAAVAHLSIADTWTAVKIELPVGQPVHESLRLELYTGTPGVELLIDGVVVR